MQVVLLGTKISRTVFDTEIKSSDTGPTTPVPGIGETAFAVPGAVTVFDKGLALVLEVVKKGKPAGAGEITPLLKKALGRADAFR